MLYQHLHFAASALLRKAGLRCSMQGDPQSPSHHTPGYPSSSACLRVFLCMSSSVMPWYTRVSFHTGLRVLRSVFVLSLFDYSIKTKHGMMTPLNSSPPKFQLLAEECKLDAPSPLAHKSGLTGLCRMSLLPAEAVAPVSHQLQVSITNLTRWTFMPAPGTQLPSVARAAFTAQVFSLSGVYSLKDPCTRKSCAGQAAWGLGNGSCGLKEMTAWETRSPVLSLVHGSFTNRHAK